MPNVFAVVSGNWNSPATWNTGTLPTTADDVFSNNFTVTLTNNVQVLSLRNTAATGINAGGRFRMNTLYNITADIYANINSCVDTTASITAGTVNFTGNFFGGVSFDSYAIRFTGWTNVTFNIIGNSTGGSNQATGGILLSCTNSTINFTGTLTGGTTLQSYGISIAGPSWIGTITGNCLGGVAGNNGLSTHNAGFQLNAPTSNITIIGNCTGGANGNFGASLSNVATSSILTIIGVATGGAGALATGAFGAFNWSPGGTLRVLSAVGSQLADGVGGLSTNITTVQQITAFLNGSYGIGANVRMLRTSINQITMIDELGGTITMSNPTNIANQLPAATNVRQGTIYAAGNLVGTLNVPIPSNVRQGIATDNTVGTAILTAADLWNTPLTSLNSGIGARLKNVSTVATTGDQLAALI